MEKLNIGLELSLLENKYIYHCLLESYFIIKEKDRTYRAKHEIINNKDYSRIFIINKRIEINEILDIYFFLNECKFHSVVALFIS